MSLHTAKAKQPPVARHKKKRKSPRGNSTNALVHSCEQGNNDSLFPKILSLYVAKGSKIADVTYGKGVFWKNIPTHDYQMMITDSRHETYGTDCRDLPYKPNTIDCVVFDPPYMHTASTAHQNHQRFEENYRNNASRNGSTEKYHDAILELYFNAGDEAYRVLREDGFYIVKCADEVCSNQQRLTHVEIINVLEETGFVTEDLFVLMRNSKPGLSRAVRQIHARKNHSYFIVLRKSKPSRRWPGLPTNKTHSTRRIADSGTQASGRKRSLNSSGSSSKSIASRRRR
jgi:hypothetical protein